MTLLIPHLWIYFGLCLADVLVTQRIMAGQGKHFFYFEGGRKPFTMLNLEFPKDLAYFYTVLSGIDKLEPADAAIVKRNVRAQLWVDFIFMPGTYTGVFLVCMAAAEKSGGVVNQVFAGLAWFQVVCWLLDITENIYLFSQLRQAKKPSAFGFACYRVLELLKWLPSGGGFIAALVFLALRYFFH
jgi:hypothetical protein